MNRPPAGSHVARSLDEPITTAAQLLVEGYDSYLFSQELLKFMGFERRIEVRNFGGNNDLKAFLELFGAKVDFNPVVRRLGIVRDAESGTAQSALTSVQGCLRSVRAVELPPPSQMRHFEGDPVAVGVFILPNCKDVGMLETLCIEAVEEIERTGGAAVLPCVDKFFNCLKQAKGELPKNPAKARFAGYLVARDKTDRQLGRAAQQGAVPWEAKAFDPLKGFLTDWAG